MESADPEDTSGPHPPRTSSVQELATTTDDAAAIHHPPPFWNTNRHGRTVSDASYTSVRHLRPPPIRLEDHSEEDHEQGKACWAKHVTIEDYTVVSGGTGIGAYVVWNCTVETLKGGPFTIRKRYVYAIILTLAHCPPSHMSKGTPSSTN